MIGREVDAMPEDQTPVASRTDPALLNLAAKLLWTTIVGFCALVVTTAAAAVGATWALRDKMESVETTLRNETRQAIQDLKLDTQQQLNIQREEIRQVGQNTLEGLNKQHEGISAQLKELQEDIKETR